MKANPMNDQAAMYFLSIGVIEVDEYGNIWKLKRKAYGRILWYNIKPRRCESETKKNEYLFVTCKINKINYRALAHRIVWLATKCLIPEGLEINHKNGIKDDNRPKNLELVTHSQNTIHRYKVLGILPVRGEDSGRAKIKEQDVRDIRALHAKGGITYRELGKRYGLTQTAVGLIVRRVNWAHVV